jgi:hypothetical protein
MAKPKNIATLQQGTLQVKALTTLRGTKDTSIIQIKQNTQKRAMTIHLSY